MSIGESSKEPAVGSKKVGFAICEQENIANCVQDVEETKQTEPSDKNPSVNGSIKPERIGSSHSKWKISALLSYERLDHQNLSIPSFMKLAKNEVIIQENIAGKPGKVSNFPFQEICHVSVAPSSPTSIFITSLGL